MLKQCFGIENSIVNKFCSNMVVKDNKKIVSHATKTESMSQVYMYMSIVHSRCRHCSDLKFNDERGEHFIILYPLLVLTTTNQE